MNPGLYALAITGILWIVILVIGVVNYKGIFKLAPAKLILVLSLFGTLVGIHGLLHLGIEHKCQMAHA
jgi:hypothetical protein